MTKPTHLIQMERHNTLIKRLIVTAVTLILVTTYLTVPQSAYAIYTSALSGNTATLTGDVTAETLIIDVDGGGNLRHNRFTAGDLAFNSDLDWDTTQLGDQTLANAPGVTILIRAGAGNDEIILGTPTTPASLLVVTFDISGQGDSDTLTINNSLDATARNVSVSSSSITGIGGGPITYAAIETIQITTGTGNDTINVGSVINSLDGIKTVTVNSGGASDTLNLNDQGDTNANTYTLSSTSVQRTLPAPVVVINYSNTESLALNAGTNNDTITVQNSLALTPIQINSGDGNDSLNVGNPSNSLDNLQSALTINGGASGTDSVTLVDTSESDANTYTITPNSVQRGSAVINYNNTMDNLVVNAGVSTDTLIVTGTLGLSVNTYSVTSSTIQRSGVATITYNATVENLFLNGGPAKDIFNLQSTLIPTTVSGDAEEDSFVFANGVTLLGGTIAGGSGSDTIDYTAYTSDVTVNLTLGTATGTAGISSIRYVWGGLGNDTFTGSTVSNIFSGGPGNDTYHFLNNWGNDTIIEQVGAGSDTMNFSSVNTALTITLSSATVTDGLNTATHSGNEIESLISGTNNDTFNVDSSALTSHSIAITGGPHSTGDVLNFNAGARSVVTSTTTITAEGRQPLFYTQIEQVNISNIEFAFLPIIFK